MNFLVEQTRVCSLTKMSNITHRASITEVSKVTIPAPYTMAKPPMTKCLAPKKTLIQLWIETFLTLSLECVSTWSQMTAQLVYTSSHSLPTPYSPSPTSLLNAAMLFKGTTWMSRTSWCSYSLRLEWLDQYYATVSGMRSGSWETGLIESCTYSLVYFKSLSYYPSCFLVASSAAMSPVKASMETRSFKSIMFTRQPLCLPCKRPTSSTHLPYQHFRP